MNCKDIAGNVAALARGSLTGAERDACLAHIGHCEDCAAALRGAEAMQLLRDRGPFTAPEGLFERIVDAVSTPRRDTAGTRRFWLGTAFGGAIAASLLAVVLMLGILVRPIDVAPRAAEFYVSADEPRLMHLAIEADQALPGAEISILLSGNVEIDGTGGRRELTWTDDLEAGVNRLSLPLLARGDGGGQMVVRLRHPDSEQLFVIDLRLDG